MLSQDASQPLVASDRSPKRRRLEVASLGNRDVGHSDRYSQDASREALRPIEPSGSLSTARPSESIAHSAMNQAPSQEPQVLHQGPPSSEEWVCFGMINDLQFEPQLADIAEGSFAVEIDDIGQILTQANSVIGKFSERQFPVFESLLGRSDVQLQSFCQGGFHFALPKASQQYYKKTTLNVIIYGTLSLSDAVGDLFGQNGLYLQDPVGCCRSIRYANPHRLSFLDQGGSWTSMTQIDAPEQVEYVTNLVDFFSGFESGLDLPETEAAPLVRTSLFRHQRQALTFLMEREKGWNLHAPGQDIWTRQERNGGFVQYLNNVTGLHQSEPPPPFSGGVLADHMGLGKSLTMIALIASDVTSHQRVANIGAVLAAQPANKVSLLIVPSTLIISWEAQIGEHLAHRSIMLRRHHGKSRLQTSQEISDCNIVISSYETIASEWRRNGAKENPIFSFQWRRILLDEAHNIRNMNTITAQAVCALKASSRWVVTGTPIQNKLSDLASLLQFLQIYPYCDRKSFARDITRTWKESAEDLAIDRLKKLLKFIMLRRSASTIELPPRRDTIIQLHFSSEERRAYETVRAQTIREIDRQLYDTWSESSSFSYVNALQRVTALRKICSLGVGSVPAAVDAQESHMSQAFTKWCLNTAIEAFNNMLTVGGAVCSNCFEDLEELDREFQTSSAGSPKRPWLTECLNLLCGKCVAPSCLGLAFQYCSHNPPCPAVELSTTPSTGLQTRYSEHLLPDMNCWPTKVKALKEDLSRLGDEKAIVFSCWTSTLDVIEVALGATGVKYARIDGKVTQKDRVIALAQFDKDPNTRVLLLSMSCGAVGLNLTVASRAYLFEPHWNPTMEEQALARIHRIGQTRAVTTIRYIMKDSYEEHVVKVQDRKKSLAEILLSQGKASEKDLTLSRLHHLRSLLV